MVNEIICGDCLEVMKQIEKGSIDLVVTDPPYKTITGGDSDGKNSVRPKGMLGGNRRLFKHQDINHFSWLKEIYRVLKDGTHCYVFTNSLNLKNILNSAEQAGFLLHNILVWEKNNCTPSQFYMKNAEYVLFLRKGRAKWIKNIGTSKTVHRFINIIGKKKHPTEKPVDLIAFYIQNSSEQDSVVLDPFLGSGTTAEAAIKTGRKFIGIELDPHYCNIAKDRIEKFLEGAN